LLLAFKILIAASAFGISLFYGFKTSKKYSGRELYFSELVQFCSGLAGEIGFRHAALADIFNKYAAIFKSLLSAQLKAAGEIVADGEIIDEAALRGKLPKGALKPEEYDNVLLFFNTLGKSDADNQIDSASSFKAIFQTSLEQARLDKKKYAPLYWKLGLLGACAFVIVII